jgi:hypothetical protein
MAKRALWVLGCIAAALPAASARAEVDGSKPLLCAVTEVVQCDQLGNCVRGTPEDVNIPRFVDVDPGTKQLREHGGTETSSIQNLVRGDGRLVLQGAERGRGWSIYISEATGQLSAAISDDGWASAIFGSCTQR